MFMVMILFIVGQAVINFNHGAVATPLYNYGMYSEVFKVKPVYAVIKVEVNGRNLRGEDFSIQQWDKIYLPIRYYLAADSNNNQMIDIRNRMFSKLGLHSLQSSNHHFTNTIISPKQFMDWYAKYLDEIVEAPVQSVLIKQQPFSSQKTILSPITDTDQLILPAWNSATGTVVK